MFSTELVVQTAISGVMIGVLYALMALGITFIYSIMRMINWAMGEFYMIGSYLQYMLVAWALGPDLWWLAILISTAGVFVLGLVVQWGLIKPIFKKPPELRDDYATVVTLALLLFLRSVATGLAGPNQFTPGSNLPIVMVGPMPLAGARVAAFLFALAALTLFGPCCATPGTGWRCAQPLRAASACRPPASTCCRSTVSPSASVWRSRVWRARFWRRCSWSSRPTG